MSAPAFFYGGIRLADNAKGWRPSPSRGDQGQQQGVTRRYAYLLPDSPNWTHDLDVETDVAPVSARSGLDKRTTLAIDQSTIQADLMALSQSGLWDVSWCADDTRKGNVTGAFAAGVRDVSHDALGGSWVTTAGDYLLLRNPTTGAGYCLQIQSRTAGTVRLSLPVAITTDWDIVDIQAFYPFMMFVRMDPGTYPSGDPVADTFRPEAHYLFVGNARPVNATRFNPPLV